MTDASYSYMMCGYTNCIFDIYRKIHQHREMNNVTNMVTNLTAVYSLSLLTYDLTSYSLKMFTHSGKHLRMKMLSMILGSSTILPRLLASIQICLFHNFVKNCGKLYNVLKSSLSCSASIFVLF
jgi:hypothetical protein